MTAQAAGVEVSGLCKSFGDHLVLRGVDLSVPARSLTAILGPSGSGKTTLLRLLAGFTRPERGTITIGGSEVDGPQRHVAPELRKVGYVPQEGSLFPHLDVKANVAFGLPRAKRRARVAELLDLTGMADLAGRYPHQLSGGQQQRVALARALAPEPALVLLDEPFSSLDAVLRTSVRAEVARILRQAGTTALLVTHDQDEALSMADEVAVLREGRVAQVGPPQQVYDRPADPVLATFVGEANLLAGRVRAGRVDTPLGTLALASDSSGLSDGAAVVVLVRPEQLRLVAPGEQGAITGVVVQSDYHGHDSLVAVTIEGDRNDQREPVTQPQRINVRCSGASAIPPGRDVGLVAAGTVVAWAAAEPLPPDPG